MCSTGFRCARRSKSSCAWYLVKKEQRESISNIYNNKAFLSQPSQFRPKCAFKYLIIFTIWLYNNYVYKMRKNTGASPTEMWLPPMNKAIKIYLNLVNLIIDQVKKTMDIYIYVYYQSCTERKPRSSPSFWFFSISGARSPTISFSISNAVYISIVTSCFSSSIRSFPVAARLILPILLAWSQEKEV